MASAFRSFSAARNLYSSRAIRNHGRYVPPKAIVVAAAADGHASLRPEGGAAAVVTVNERTMMPLLSIRTRHRLESSCAWTNRRRRHSFCSCSSSSTPTLSLAVSGLHSSPGLYRTCARLGGAGGGRRAFSVDGGSSGGGGGGGVGGNGSGGVPSSSSSSSSSTPPSSSPSSSSPSAVPSSAYVHPLSQIVLEHLQTSRPNFLTRAGSEDRNVLTINADGTFVLRFPSFSIEKDQEGNAGRSRTLKDGNDKGGGEGDGDDGKGKQENGVGRIWTNYDPEEKKHWLNVHSGDLVGRYLMQDNLKPAWHTDVKSTPEKVREAVDEMIDRLVAREVGGSRGG